MKLRKIIASIAAASIAVTSMATISASAINAGGTTIDFEDGDFSFVYMNVDEGADASVLSVEEYNGSKALKVDVQDKTLVPKVWFDLDKITDRSNTVQIRKITFDLAIVPKTAEGMVGWAGGAVGAAGGYDLSLPGKGQADPAWSDKAWDGGAYEPGVAAEIKVERKFMMSNEFYTETGVNPFFGLMRWAAAEDTQDNYYMYFDNIQLLDANGNALPIGVTPAEEPAEEEAATEETTEAPAEEATTEAPAEEATTEAPAEEAVEEVAVEEEVEVEAEPAPEADTTTAPVATGNVAAASIAAVMAIAGAAAIASKKRN